MSTKTRTVAEHAEAIAVALGGIGVSTEIGTHGDTVVLDRATLATAQWLLRGRVLAEDVFAAVPLPPFDNAQMDGYAVRAADVSGASSETPVTLTVAPPIVAGETGRALEPGEAAPIMTGAPMPPGADSVIPIELTAPSTFGEYAEVTFSAPTARGTFVRTAGSDVAAGELLVAAGARLTPAVLGVLAAAGRTDVRLRRRTRVLLVITGHEVRAPGSQLEPGQIWDANSFSLWAALTDIGADVETVPCESDDPASLAALLDAHAGTADLVLTVGGVSAGAREVVRDVLTPLGVWFGSVAMQPGGPQGLGVVTLGDHRVPVVCLPGNPVSCLVSFEVFLRPVLADRSDGRRHSSAPLAEPLSSPVHKHQVRRARLDDGRVALVGGASSHLLHAYARSTHLAHIPVGEGELAAGTDVEIWRIDEQ